MKTAKILVILVLVLGIATEVANADFTFDAPTNLGPTVNSSSWEYGPSISADGLSLYFTSKRPDGYGSWDIWVATRETVDAPWGEPVNLGPTVNSSVGDGGPNISADGLELFFESTRSGGQGSWDIWVMTRATVSDPWGTPVNLGPTVNSSANDSYASISADRLSLYFTSGAGRGGYGGRDIWVATRETIHDPWGSPVNLGPPVNTTYGESCPSISADGLALYFSDYPAPRPGGVGGHDIWVTTRPSVSEPWGSPVNLGPPVNTIYAESYTSISADGRDLYFSDFGGLRPGGIGQSDVWQVSIRPVVDFNGDGIVDCVDMCMMIDHWGTGDPLCDIGPMPWGDGIVDVQDLIVLAEYLLTYPGAVAYWKLDETEGNIAYDSVAANDGTVFGDAVWQPEGGHVNGALQFDGIDDYVSTPLMLDPTAKAVFSVFAWVKGGMPGQVVFSQAGPSDWLGADTTNGSLMTELRFFGRTSRPLQSQTIITDGHWHRIGLAWDGSNRILYVDDGQVASDTYDKGYLIGDLQIGVGKNLDPGTFFSGLIDDVRIYNRVLTP
jgi:Tol biopolymer transport system component